MASRSTFLTAATALAAASVAAPALADAFPSGLRKPPMLRPGDLVGLVAPASPLSEDEIARGIRQVESLGLKTRLAPHARSQNGYLAGTDAERAADFNAMARDPKIRAIFALRGGYGTMRILDDLDYAALRADPKIVLGFSDMTAVLNAVTARSKLVTFHGPVAALSTFDTTTDAALQRALMSREPIGTLHSAGITRLHGGRATGPLAGGNLSLVAGSPVRRMRSRPTAHCSSWKRRTRNRTGSTGCSRNWRWRATSGRPPAWCSARAVIVTRPGPRFRSTRSTQIRSAARSGRRSPARRSATSPISGSSRSASAQPSTRTHEP